MPAATAGKAAPLALTAAQKLSDARNLGAFACGEASINEYLVKKPIRAQSTKTATINRWSAYPRSRRANWKHVMRRGLSVASARGREKGAARSARSEDKADHLVLARAPRKTAC